MMNTIEKEKSILDSIEKAKTRLAKLRKKKILDMGKLAQKHGLHKANPAFLEKAFAKIAKDLENHANAG
mgnify:CR=1 FL=1